MHHVFNMFQYYPSFFIFLYLYVVIYVKIKRFNMTERVSILLGQIFSNYKQ